MSKIGSIIARKLAPALLFFLACTLLTSCATGLSAIAPTTTRASDPGWCEFTVPSAGVAFTAPTTDPKAIHEFSNPTEFQRFIGVDPSDETQGDVLGARYSRFIALREGEVVYTLWVEVVDDDKLAMLIQVFGRASRKAEEHAEISVSGYPGIEAISRSARGVDADRSWTAADRFYVAGVHAASEAAFSKERAKAFLGSIRMLDHP